MHVSLLMVLIINRVDRYELTVAWTYGAGTAAVNESYQICPPWCGSNSEVKLVNG